jgi:hypothetical protein
MASKNFYSNNKNLFNLHEWFLSFSQYLKNSFHRENTDGNQVKGFGYLTQLTRTFQRQALFYFYFYFYSMIFHIFAAEIG